MGKKKKKKPCDGMIFYVFYQESKETKEWINFPVD